MEKYSGHLIENIRISFLFFVNHGAPKGPYKGHIKLLPFWLDQPFLVLIWMWSDFGSDISLNRNFSLSYVFLPDPKSDHIQLSTQNTWSNQMAAIFPDHHGCTVQSYIIPSFPHLPICPIWFTVCPSCGEMFQTFHLKYPHFFPFLCLSYIITIFSKYVQFDREYVRTILLTQFSSLFSLKHFLILKFVRTFLNDPQW